MARLMVSTDVLGWKLVSMLSENILKRHVPHLCYCDDLKYAAKSKCNSHLMQHFVKSNILIFADDYVLSQASHFHGVVSTATHYLMFLRWGYVDSSLSDGKQELKSERKQGNEE